MVLILDGNSEHVHARMNEKKVFSGKNIWFVTTLNVIKMPSIYFLVIYDNI